MFNNKPATNDADNQAAKPSTETLGCYLKAARLSQELELTEIAAETRIDIKNIIALEDDNRSALPADVFTRGFIKIYASHLKLDPQEAIRRYEQQWGADLNFEVVPLEKIKSPPSFWPGIIIATTLIAILFGIRFLTSESPIDTGITPVTDTSSPVSPVIIPPTPDTETPLLQPPPAADIPAPQTPPGTEHPPYEIVLTCAEELPMTISLDSVRTTESVCPPRSPQTWRADKGFDLTLSTTRGVTLTINGINVPIMEAE
ncbi:MAG: helix-turn-helix transcriptional regulator, partial [Desulfobulbaceae bacterium]|nr:helix-turn-helix transcriptional regulator [Desulfobulbaceae bacterium]